MTTSFSSNKTPYHFAEGNKPTGQIDFNSLFLIAFLFFHTMGCEASLDRAGPGRNAETSSDTAGDDTVGTSTIADSAEDTSSPASRCDEQLPVNDVTPCSEKGIEIQPPWDEHYSCVNLGPIPNVPPEWGGLTLHPNDQNALLIGGNSNEESGKLYKVGITRDSDCHITGFSPSPTTVFSSAKYNDGGIAFGSSGVLFLARWPVNQIGQLLPGSTVEDKVIDLEPLNITSSPGGLGFVPTGFAGEGDLKTVSWPSGDWFTLTLAPDVNGTFDITGVTKDTTIPGGPEGFVYINQDNFGFGVDSILVAEWTDNNIAAYESDSLGNPSPLTRKEFVLGLDGAEGAIIDPHSGDFLFITWGGAEILIAIRGFHPPVL